MSETNRSVFIHYLLLGENPAIKKDKYKSHTHTQNCYHNCKLQREGERERGGGEREREREREREGERERGRWRGREGERGSSNVQRDLEICSAVDGEINYSIVVAGNGVRGNRGEEGEVGDKVPDWCIWLHFQYHNYVLGEHIVKLVVQLKKQWPYSQTLIYAWYSIRAVQL